MFDALLLASFLTGPAFRAMTNGFPSSAAAGAGSTFFGVTFGFKARENVDFAAGTDEAAAETAGGSATLFASAAGTAAVKGVTKAMLEAALATAVSVEESGFSLISCRKNEKQTGCVKSHAMLTCKNLSASATAAEVAAAAEAEAHSLREFVVTSR
jgi:hypothetical protein